MRFRTTFSSPLGQMIATSDGEALTGLYFEGQKHLPAWDDAMTDDTLPAFRATRCWLEAYFSGKRPTPTPKLRPQGTPFRRRVWRILTEIPRGSTLTYGEIARRIADEMHTDRMAAQAVGGAIGDNPIAIIIPCHRAVGVGGKLTGYAGGLERKAWLLDMESRRS